MIYLDSSAFVKLVLPESETRLLAEFLVRHAKERLVSSTLLTIEVRRAVARGGTGQLSYADVLLEDVGQLPVSERIVESASRLPGAGLRSLDAIHLATALLLRAELGAFVTYDKRLAAAAQQHALPVVTPC